MRHRHITLLPSLSPGSFCFGGSFHSVSQFFRGTRIDIVGGRCIIAYSTNIRGYIFIFSLLHIGLKLEGSTCWNQTTMSRIYWTRIFTLWRIRLYYSGSFNDTGGNIFWEHNAVSWTYWAKMFMWQRIWFDIHWYIIATCSACSVPRKVTFSTLLR